MTRVGSPPLARWVVPAAVGILAVVALVFLQVQGQRLNGGTGQSHSLRCSPQPCLNLQNYTLWVSNVTESIGIVRMQITFQNGSDSMHAAPEDLHLVDAQGHDSPGIQNVTGCTQWSRTEFANGAKFGPITVCFRPDSAKPPLTLHWTPDMGLFCCDGTVRIE